MYFPREEYEDRWRRLHREMRARDLEWALVWGRSGGTFERYSDVLYLSNYYSSQSGHEYDSDSWMGVSFTAMLVGLDGEPEMIVDEPDFPSHLTPLADRMTWEKNVIRGAARMVRQRGIDRIALVGTDFLPMKYWRVLKEELPRVEWIDSDDLVREVRRAKSPRELDCYREIGEKVTASLDAMVELAVKGGVTQAEVAAVGTAELMRRGGVPHMVPVSSGPTLFRHCGDPLLGFSPDVVLEQGDMVRMWIYGPVFQGYWSDPGRTVIVGGKGTARQRELIEQANEIITVLMNEIRPGVKVADIATRGNEMRSATETEDDQPGKMWPIYGHGVGLFWEDPWLMASDGDKAAVFHSGQTYSTEVFLHRHDVGSAGVEQNFIVGDARNELLTTTDLTTW
jgi:Xaa-Pro aminopeptidase